MRILIIEDEKLAANRLQKLITSVIPEASVVKTLTSIKTAVDFFRKGRFPDLAFFDIQLSDGLSFEIFEEVSVPCPVIFTTAYDQYALRAFKVNSVDYLLKPIREEDLVAAIDKFKERINKNSTLDLNLVQRLIQEMAPTYKSRFMVKTGEHLLAVPVEDILYFFSEEKVTFLLTRQNKRYIIDYSLDHLEQMVHPSSFFRVNRAFLVGFKAISKIIAYSGNRLKITMSAERSKDVLVSWEKVGAFKLWLDE